jgi:fumarate hydratase class I
MAEFVYTPILPIGADATEYECIATDHVSTIDAGGRTILQVEPAALELLAARAMSDISFFLRRSHLDKVAKIIDDPEASDNDRYVAATMLRNAIESAAGILPMCQDTGTATVVGKKGEQVWTGGNDEVALSRGIFNTFKEKNLRYSQLAPLTMFDEKNTGTNLPAQIDLYATVGNEYHFLFMAKGGGSANKFKLFQETKAILNDKSMALFLHEKVFDLGTAACPPYHIAIVIGGTSAEATLKTVKLASAGYLDGLPTEGHPGGQAFRDLEWEARAEQIARETQIGAQFKGKYLAHDIRVIRLPRHAASCPVGIGVSCSADRNVKAKITSDGIFIEKLERDPSRYQDKINVTMEPPVTIDLDRSIADVLAELSEHSIGTRLLLNGTLIVARDVAHARIKKMLDDGEPMPDYLMKHPVYYAGPAKTPEGMASGSFGPTTANRMDVYVDEFQAHGGSMIMLAKGNRSDMVTVACGKHGGFYLGSIGGPAAILAKESILKVELVDFEDLGMEAVRKIEVKDFPAFIICDDKGNNLFG